MLTTSKGANKNYLAKVVKLEGVKKHSNADRLQTVDIDFNTVITGMDAKDGDIYIYFPVESKINELFLSETNSFSNKLKNFDQEKKGYFGDKCRVKATRLRGEKSMGYIVPVTEVYKWANHPNFLKATKNKPDGVFIDVADIGTEFDTINGIKLVEKYQVELKKGSRVKQGKSPSLNRLVDGQVHLHADTEKLRRNAHKIKVTDVVSITYKEHGTSWWVSNVIVKRKLSFLEKISKRLGLKVEEQEYDKVYGSRRVVKNKYLEDPKAKDHFFGYDLWEGIKDEIGHLIPKGYTLYGEMVGYDANGRAIQKGYDYGCSPHGLRGNPYHKLTVYRITSVNPDGVVVELSYPQIAEFCGKVGLTPSHLYFYGTAGEWLSQNSLLNNKVISVLSEKNFQETFVKTLEAKYNEKDCFMCVNKVPEEGVIVRKDSLYSYEAYKLKSFSFLEWESKELDKETIDIESEN